MHASQDMSVFEFVAIASASIEEIPRLCEQLLSSSRVDDHQSAEESNMAPVSHSASGCI